MADGEKKCSVLLDVTEPLPFGPAVLPCPAQPCPAARQQPTLPGEISALVSHIVTKMSGRVPGSDPNLLGEMDRQENVALVSVLAPRGLPCLH